MIAPIPVLLREPHPKIAAAVATAAQAHGFAPLEALQLIESSPYLHDEAPLLGAEELAEAASALQEDGIFDARPWEEAGLRSATRYGWALAHAARMAAELPSGPRLWSLAQTTTPTFGDELRFLVEEIQQRRLAVTYLALCWPMSIEPAVELEERQDAFLQAVESYAAALREAGPGLLLPHAANKLTILPAAAAQLGDRLLLDLAGLGWLETARVLARNSPAFFRQVLQSAQQHFIFDKPVEHLSTTEDDVRFLPEVPDAELERFFLDDFRGRQLLHVSASSIFAESELGAALEEFLRDEEPWKTAIAVQMEKHAAALRPAAQA